MTETTAKSSNKPVKVFRLRGVKAAVFENHSGDSVFHKVALQRVYKDGDEFKTTTGLGRDDLPVARHVLQKAWEWILETEASRSREVVIGESFSEPPTDSHTIPQDESISIGPPSGETRKRMHGSTKRATDQ